MFSKSRQPKMETQCMTKQQAPHSPERCAGVPGHKKDAAAGEGNLSTTLSLPRGTQGIKLPLHAVIKNNGKRLTLLCGKKTICETPRSTNAILLISKFTNNE